MRTLIPCLMLGIILTSAGVGAAPETDASPRLFLEDGRLDLHAVVHHFENLYRADSSIAVADFTVTRPNRTRTMTMKIWSRGRDEALILIQAPVREAGTATLKVSGQPLELSSADQAHHPHSPLHDARLLDGERFHQ